MGDWNLDGFKPSAEFRNIIAIDGDVTAIDDIMRPDKFKENAPDKPAYEIHLENIDNIEMKGGADAPKLPDGTFKITFNKSAVEGSLHHAWVIAASKLTNDLPDGLVGKRIRFTKEVVRAARGQNQEWSVLVPSETLSDNNASIEDVIGLLLESSNKIKDFKRAFILDSRLNSNEELMKSLKDNSIFAKYGYVVGEDSESFAKK